MALTRAGAAQVLVGIGGSDLGPRAIYMALQGYKKAGRRVHFVSNVDPDDAAAVLKGVPDLKKTLVVVCSKSGGTLETLTNEQLVRDFFVKAVRATPARTPACPTPHDARAAPGPGPAH